jgi:hypothetical protein
MISQSCIISRSETSVTKLLFCMSERRITIILYIAEHIVPFLIQVHFKELQKNIN